MQQQSAPSPHPKIRIPLLLLLVPISKQGPISKQAPLKSRPESRIRALLREEVPLSSQNLRAYGFMLAFIQSRDQLILVGLHRPSYSQPGSQLDLIDMVPSGVLP